MNHRTPVLPILISAALALVPCLGAELPAKFQVVTDAPDAVLFVTYNGGLTLRAKPIAVIDTNTDLGRLRVEMKMNDKGVYEGTTFLNRIGSYAAHFEGTDLINGTRLRDDNDGKLYGFEVTSQAQREAREAELQRTAQKRIQLEHPQFRKAASLFFNGRQPSDARVAIVRGADGRSVYRVRVENGGARKVTVLEQVR